ncbi:MAG TPA: RNB domain-containing ribonuclease, partial [Candidatus Paceibacterota bacterium]
MPRNLGGLAHTKEAPKKHITGVIQLTRKPVGYVAWPNEPEKDDIEIFVEKLNGALNGDTVEVELIGLGKAFGKRPARFQGRVKKILERAKEEFVCTIKGDTAIPADLKFYKPITIHGGDYEDGEKVLVHLDSFDGTVAKGTVIEHIGRAGEHRVEMNAIVLEHGFATDFPAKVLAEAAQIERDHAAIIASEIPKRTDFRSTTTFTIDPKDAKDFDDALSVEALPDGTYEIGVHIADATYFCRPGTAIDDEAIKRGTSVYLVDAT